MGRKITENMVEEAVEHSNIYPRPEKSMVRDNMEKMSRIVSASGSGMSRRALIRRTAKAVRMKKRLDEDEWIEYDGELFELER